MNNFSVLLKYSIKPKFASKKALLGLLVLFLFPLLIISLGGNLLLTIIEDENFDDQHILADEIYIYPQDEIATYLQSEIPEAKVTNQLPSSLISDTDENSQIVIDTKNIAIMSDFTIDITEIYQINALIDNAVLDYKLDIINSDLKQQLHSISNQIEFINVYDENNDNKDVLEIINIISTLIVYFLVLFGIQILGGEIFEEKSSRAMEIIITNTKPHVHIFVKIISTLLFLISYILAMGMGLVIGFVILGKNNPDTIGQIIDLGLELLQQLNIVVDVKFVLFIIFTLISSILSILMFQVIAAVIAAVSNSYEDYQKANGPIILLLLVPYMISFSGIVAINKLLVVIPLFTPFFAPSLFIANDLSIQIYGLCIFIQIVSLVIIYKLAAPVYREGLLTYSTSSIKDIIKRSYIK